MKEKEKLDEELKEERKCTEGEECNCTSECTCDEGEECSCGDSCSCNDECSCGPDCNCRVEEVDRLQAMIVEMDDKVKYAQAELVNYRKRKDEEVSSMLKFANQDLILEFIPVLDNFERAIKLAKSDDEKLNSFLDGFKMLYSHIVDTLKQFGVEEIDALGKEFDPNLHLALITDKDETKANDTILEVLLKGYTLKGKMIRPASVKINKLD